MSWGLFIEVETYSCFEVEIYQQRARTPLAGEYARSRPPLQIEQNYESRLAGDVFPQKIINFRMRSYRAHTLSHLGSLFTFQSSPPVTVLFLFGMAWFDERGL
jgi:hypothetical protein